MKQKGYIYFTTNKNNTVLYVGVTNSIKRRITEHSEGRGSVFTSKYKCSKLIYFEALPTIEQAIAREKQLKHFKREWKNQLVEAINPEWKDLSGYIIDDPDLI
ncbi:MAG: GIY-YIG nuclease family protein [Bacteroidales bacterium]|nr:GIY-YIG nuclease family protein [Bacteroidales bacterium]